MNGTQQLWPGMVATERALHFAHVNHIKDLYGTKQAVPAPRSSLMSFLYPLENPQKYNSMHGFEHTGDTDV